LKHTHTRHTKIKEQSLEMLYNAIKLNQREIKHH